MPKKQPAKESKYIYKLWLHMERIEVDEDGKPLDTDSAYTPMENEGYEPAELGRFDSIQEADTSMRTYERIAASFTS